MPKYTLEDIISIDNFKSSLSAIAKASEMNLCIIDLTGNVIVWPTNDTEFCNAARSNPQIKSTCLFCASHAALEAARQKKPFIYRCVFGLLDFAIPIFYKGDVLGVISGGQIKTENADAIAHYSYPAKDISDMPELAALLEKIPSAKSERLFAVVDLLQRIIARLPDYSIAVGNGNINDTYYPEGIQKLRPALDFIKENYNKNISLNELAKLCYVSESYFSRFFKATMGINLSQYITNLRIDKAKTMLADPQMKILAIAFEIGYNDSAYFIRKFKEVTKQTPVEYRKTLLA